MQFYVFFVVCYSCIFGKGGSNLLFVVCRVWQESWHVKHYFMALINGVYWFTTRGVPWINHVLILNFKSIDNRFHSLHRQRMINEQLHLPFVSRPPLYLSQPFNLTLSPSKETNCPKSDDPCSANPNITLNRCTINASIMNNNNKFMKLLWTAKPSLNIYF